MSIIPWMTWKDCTVYWESNRKKREFYYYLSFVLADWTVRASHCAAAYYLSAMDTFVCAMAVNMLPGRSLKAAVAVRCGTAVDTAFFVSVMLMESVQGFGTAGTEFSGTAMNAFGHKKPL